MFTGISLKNYRTHKDTNIQLGPITLLLGSNNAGKTNFLNGVSHFAKLIRNLSPHRSDYKHGYQLRSSDLFPHRHRLAKSDEPMSFSCNWSNNHGKIDFHIELYENDSFSENVGVREKINVSINNAGEYQEENGFKSPSNTLLIRNKMFNANNEDLKRLSDDFFRDLAGCYIFNFQSSFLKRDVEFDDRSKNGLRIASQLGFEGGYLQHLLRRVQKNEVRTFNNFQTLLRRFEPNFQGITAKNGKTYWLFDLGSIPARTEEFLPELVSDGLLKASAIALLAAMRKPPALTIIEEIENGISQQNLSSFFGWLGQATGTIESSDRGYKTQFIITSHSPSILREFANNLENAYFLRLQKKNYRSIVSNLGSTLASYVDLGTIDGDVIQKEGSLRVAQLAPRTLIDLWYSGQIGGEIGG